VSAAARAPAALSLADAVERLRAPDAPERYSPLTGEPLFAVDFSREGRRLAPEHVVAARAALASLPAPTVALRGRRLPRGAEELIEGFDVVIEGADALGALAERTARSPLAALALVQLLRHAERLDVEGGLCLESLVYATLQAGPEFAAWRAGREPKAPAPEAEPVLLVRRELDRLHLRLNRPARRNAFNAEMRDRLCEGLCLAACDDSIEEIVLSGEGPAFCAGGDLHEFGTLPDPATAHAIRSTRNAARLLAACAPRVRAELHGACVGAGVELPAFAARVVARPDAFFELPELALGLVPGAGGSVSLPRRIGRQRTAWLALSGARLDAETALAWGLVDELSDGVGGEA
jgi:enoyl-CoA hydratase/carnithine racemase